MPDPAWYPDPADATRARWWDGAGWTEHTRATEPAAVPHVPLVSPPQQRTAAAPAALAVRPGGPFTLAATIYALFPALGIVFVFQADIATALVEQVVFGIVTSIVSVPLAFWDRRALDAHGYTRSSLAEPWFALLPIYYLVYRLMQVGSGTLVFIVIWAAASVVTYIVPGSGIL